MRLIREEQKHIFSQVFRKNGPERMYDWEPTETEEEEIIDNLAKFLVKKGLATPAIFLLESIKPMSFIITHNLLAFGVPILGPFVDERTAAKYAAVLQKRENIERLISRMEELLREEGQEG